MIMNKLINKISELFKDDDTVKIYSYDKKILIYGSYFSHPNVREVLNIIEGECILFELTANSNSRVCIQLIKED